MTGEVQQTLAGEWISVGVSVAEVSGEEASVVFGVQWSFDGATWAVAQPDNVIGVLARPGAIVQRFTVKAPYWRIAAEVAGTNPFFRCSANALI
ncbi:hypothetical protein [Arthrobacter sp. GMC3]|uniref:hypothetical protein n=1 Tax=Arthrobacter sp. GMC3 TaxID=2058894 RepID=UPI000CE42D93|nr:hypothetical protein [Arthrobacter sp. GMC3]